MERRRFLALLATSTAAAASAACGVRFTDSPDTWRTMPVAGPGAIDRTGLLPPPPRSARVPLPGGGALTRLPGAGDMLALTVDDGANADVVGAYAQFAGDSGIRMTFFVTGSFPGWTEHAAALRPLVESRQVQLGNHTWTHPRLTRLGSAAVAAELNRNRAFLKNTFGVDATPFYRPPYGAHDKAVDAVAADLGYRAVTMWYGSLSDSGLVTQDYIVKMAHLYFKPQALVIGHANHPPVTHVYPQLLDIIKARRLRTVTLDDVFLPAEDTSPGPATLAARMPAHTKRR